MKIKIGTRKSKLAIIQTKKIEEFLKERGIETKIIGFTSQGDIDKTSPLWEIGGKGVFTKHLEKLLIEKKIDIAVHSAKDLPVDLIEGTSLIGVLNREAVQDIVVTNNRVDDIKLFLRNKKIATGSLRRTALLKNIYKSENVVSIRGNVDTRLKKLKEKDFDGLIIAKAGVKRLELLDDLFYYELNPESFTPSSGQGYIAVQGRDGLPNIKELFLKDINWKIFWVEREILKLLKADCNTPLGVYCRVKDGNLVVSLNILSIDGSNNIFIEKSVDINDYLRLPKIIFDEFNNKNGFVFMEGIKEWIEKL